MKPIAISAIGAAAFAAVQVIWSLGHVFGGWRGAWVMKSGSGIALCFASFVVVSAVVCAFRGKTKGLWNCAVSIAIGAIVAMAIALFVVGPGNLWPLVIAFDGAIIGAAVGVGAIIGKVFRHGNAA